MAETKTGALTFLVVMLIIVTLIEITVIIGLFFFADKVKCNLLWCEFTKEVNSSSEIQIGFDSQICYMNNKEVNCSKIWEEEWGIDKDRFYTIFKNKNY